MYVVDAILIILIAINSATINSQIINNFLFIFLGVSIGIYIGILYILQTATKAEGYDESLEILEKIKQTIQKAEEEDDE